MQSINAIKTRFSNAGIVEQLIYINGAVYILALVFRVFHSPFIYNWLSLSPNYNTCIYKPWSIITYGFLHLEFIHILGNLIMLFYFGNLFIDYFTKKQLLTLYLLSSIFGGVFFILGSTFIPALQTITTPLVGASAAVSAILIGIATYFPNYQMKFALIGYVKLWHIAILWIIFNLISISASQNLGGNLAHLGGALFGFFYVKQMSNTPIKLTSLISSIFPKKTKKPFNKVYKNSKKGNLKKQKTENQDKIDIILDKIGKSGYDSLSKEEKQFLFKQGK